MPSVVLKPGRVQPVWSGHPWIYAQAVDRVEGGALAGDEVSVLDPRGNILGKGYYSPNSSIPVRIATRNEATKLDAAWLRKRIQQARDLRAHLGIPNVRTTGYRLIYSEGDGIPGLVADVFDDVAAVQMTTIGVKLRQDLVFTALAEMLKLRAIIDRTPSAFARAEGFVPGTGVVWGQLETHELRFVERGLKYHVPLTVGQKTGYYFDQRPLRGRIEQLGRGRRVLDVYSFVGSFSLAAARGGARQVVAVDDSPVALEVAASCADLNGLKGIDFVRADGRQALQAAGQQGGYDLVIVDPPNLAPSKAALERALTAYQKLAALGCRATHVGGLLVFSCCSGAVDIGALTRALALGARDAGMSATVIERLYQGVDHPVPAAFDEGLYLKTLIAQINTR